MEGCHEIVRRVAPVRSVAPALQRKLSFTLQVSIYWIASQAPPTFFDGIQMNELHFLFTKSSQSSSYREIYVYIELLKKVDLGVSLIEFRSLVWGLAASWPGAVYLTICTSVSSYVLWRWWWKLITIIMIIIILHRVFATLNKLIWVKYA